MFLIHIFVSSHYNFLKLQLWAVLNVNIVFCTNMYSSPRDLYTMTLLFAALHIQEMQLEQQSGYFSHWNA